MKRSHNQAFTLIELLTVIAIIAILAVLLIPTLSTAIGNGKSAKCKSQLGQLGKAFAVFAGEYDDHLPAAVPHLGPTKPSNDWTRGWVGKEVLDGSETALPTWGIATEDGGLTPFIGGGHNVRSLVRCPGLKQGAVASSSGSNGMFDYAMISAFNGARTAHLPTKARYGNTTITAPLIVEEDPLHINGGFIETKFSQNDLLGTWHPRSASNYAAFDGSAQSIRLKDIDVEAQDLFSDNGTSIGFDKDYGSW